MNTDEDSAIIGEAISKLRGRGKREIINHRVQELARKPARNLWKPSDLARHKKSQKECKHNRETSEKRRRRPRQT